MAGHDTGQHVVHNVYTEGLCPGADWSCKHTMDVLVKSKNESNRFIAI